MRFEQITHLANLLNVVAQNKRRLRHWSPVAGDAMRAQATLKDSGKVLLAHVEKRADQFTGRVTFRILTPGNALAAQQVASVTESQAGQISVTALKVTIAEKLKANA